MDRGAWWATVQGVVESEVTESLHITNNRGVSGLSAYLELQSLRKASQRRVWAEGWVR